MNTGMQPNEFGVANSSRRNFLRASAGLLLAMGAVARSAPSAAASTGPRGAIYIPARAYNAYQAWQHYDHDTTRRDVKFARSLNLNALRVWLSYEFWLHEPHELQRCFVDFLNVCSAAEIRVMPVLFEGDGVEPTHPNIVDTNPLRASDMLSPSTAVVRNRRLWHKPLQFVDWFMQHFRNDRRLLAIELNNEPFGQARHLFAHAMMAHAAKDRGSIPLSIGGTNLAQSKAFIDAGADILQTHPDFPASRGQMEKVIQRALAAEKTLHRPVWLSEWQRVRSGASGWGHKPLGKNEWQPDYASLASTIRSAGVGNFFWSLMLKPAWLLAQRQKGTLNGVFHEDGAVWSVADARAISGNPHFHAVERKAWPRWARSIPKSLGLPEVVIG